MVIMVYRLLKESYANFLQMYVYKVLQNLFIV
jgi:hypothetical protein